MTVEQSDVLQMERNLAYYSIAIFPDSYFLYSWGACRGGNPWFSLVPQSLR